MSSQLHIKKINTWQWTAGYEYVTAFQCTVGCVPFSSQLLGRIIKSSRFPWCLIDCCLTICAIVLWAKLLRTSCLLRWKTKCQATSSFKCCAVLETRPDQENQEVAVILETAAFGIIDWQMSSPNCTKLTFSPFIGCQSKCNWELGEQLNWSNSNVHGEEVITRKWPGLSVCVCAPFLLTSSL